MAAAAAESKGVAGPRNMQASRHLGSKCGQPTAHRTSTVCKQPQLMPLPAQHSTA